LYFLILYANSPVLASIYIYHHSTGKILNLKNPKDFNEKLQWLKLYWQNPLVAKCTDKYEVREYAAKSGCEKILNEIYGIYDKSSEINWEALPKKFALKCTHGCGFNIICDDKDKLDKDQTLKQLDEWLKTRIDKNHAEIHYSKITPRIICEQYLETYAGLLPIDYKIYCFNGNARLMLVCLDRINNLKFHFVDLNWESMNIGSQTFTVENIPIKPECFDEMIKYAEILSKPFPFVRIDFYDYKGKPILGEMTFTPGACMADYYNETGLQLLGDMLNLPAKYKIT
jgi:TupA-like ATPgrasp